MQCKGDHQSCSLKYIHIYILYLHNTMAFVAALWHVPTKVTLYIKVSYSSSNTKANKLFFEQVLRHSFPSTVWPYEDLPTQYDTVTFLSLSLWQYEIQNTLQTTRGTQALFWCTQCAYKQMHAHANIYVVICIKNVLNQG